MRMVFCTCPQEEADSIADTILKDRLAACVNIVPVIRSKYWWEGQINTDNESLLIIKTRDDPMTDLINRSSFLEKSLSKKQGYGGFSPYQRSALIRGARDNSLRDQRRKR